MPTTQQERRIKKIVDIVEQGPLAVAEYLFEIEDQFDQTVKDMKEEVASLKEAVTPNLKDILDQVKGRDGVDGEKGENGDQGQQGIQGVQGIQGKDGKNGKDGKDGRDGIDGRDGRDGLNGKDGIAGKDGSIITGKEIIEKINALEIEPELQIDAKHIKGLEKSKNTVYLGPGNSGGGRIIKAYDLSASLDGATRTFSLPAFWRIVLVQLSSVPVIRPTTDYTVSGFQITFTSEISLSDLSSGQSCIVLYAES